MKKFAPAKNVMWDAWFVRRGGEIHAFYLQNGFREAPGDPAGWAVGHAVSRDALEWEERTPVLPPLFDERNPADFHSKFTGCAVNRDDVCYLFYTMRAQNDGSQRIGVAISHDWERFEPYEGNPVVVNDPALLIGYENLCDYDWNIVDCRDFIVIEDGEGGYCGYWAAAADVGRRCPVGVIAMARSRDLLHWGKQKIVYTVDHHGVLEVPDVFRMGDRWVLTCLSGMNYSGRAVCADEYANNATIYATAATPDGPFSEGEDSVLIAGPVQSGFTCRSVAWGDGRLLYYIDRAAGKTALALPKTLCMDGAGNLRACFCPLLTPYLKELPLPAFAPEPNSFAWKTYGGTCEQNGDTVRLTTGAKDYHAVSVPVEKPAAVMDATVTVNAFGGGLFFRTDAPYVVLLEPERGRLALWRLYSFEYVAARSVPLEKGRAYAVRCVLIDGVIEVYLDGVLTLQCGIGTVPVHSFGLAADRGQMTARNVCVREITESI